MLSLWLVTLAFATVPELHHVLHCDSHQPAHECSLSLVGKGELLTDPPAAMLPVVREGAVRHRLPDALIPRAIEDVRLHPGRAPPVPPCSLGTKG